MPHLEYQHPWWIARSARQLRGQFWPSAPRVRSTADRAVPSLPRGVWRRVATRDRWGRPQRGGRAVARVPTGRGGFYRRETMLSEVQDHDQLRPTSRRRRRSPTAPRSPHRGPPQPQQGGDPPVPHGHRRASPVASLYSNTPAGAATAPSAFRPAPSAPTCAGLDCARVLRPRVAGARRDPRRHRAGVTGPRPCRSGLKHAGCRARPGSSGPARSSASGAATCSR